MPSEQSKTIFQWWKFVMAALAFPAGYIGSGMETTAGALGGGAGAAIASAIVILVATVIYRRFMPTFLEPLPDVLYIGICLMAAAIGGFAGFAGVGSGAFVSTYLLLVVPAVLLFWGIEYVSGEPAA